MKTSELTGPALDWVVAKCERRTVVIDDFDELGYGIVLDATEKPDFANGSRCYAPSRYWHQSGPIIEREGIWLKANNSASEWHAGALSINRHDNTPGPLFSGPTALVAAMRCFVASKLGDEVDVPKEFLTT